MRHALLALLLASCAAPTYELDEDPIPEVFQCAGRCTLDPTRPGSLQDQYYYSATIFEDTSIFVTGALSDGVSSSSGTNFYAPGEPSGPVTVYKDGWVTMELVMIPELGIRFETEDRNWVQLGGCEHTFGGV